MNTWMEFGRMQKLRFFAAPPNFVYNNQPFGIVHKKPIKLSILKFLRPNFQTFGIL